MPHVAHPGSRWLHKRTSALKLIVVPHPPLWKPLPSIRSQLCLRLRPAFRPLSPCRLCSLAPAEHFFGCRRVRKRHRPPQRSHLAAPFLLSSKPRPPAPSTTATPWPRLHRPFVFDATILHRHHRSVPSSY